MIQRSAEIFQTWNFMKFKNCENLLGTELHFSQRKNLKSVFFIISAPLRLEARIEKGQQLKTLVRTFSFLLVYLTCCDKKISTVGMSFRISILTRPSISISSGGAAMYITSIPSFFLTFPRKFLKAFPRRPASCIISRIC